MPVSEQVRLEDPRGTRQGSRPEAPTASNEAENRATGQAEGEHRPEPRPRKRGPIRGNPVADQAFDRIKRRVAVRLLAGERPEPGDHLGRKELGTGVDLITAGRTDVARMDLDQF